MSREECLDWLYRLRGEIYVYIQPKEWLIPMNNALDMAIKALSQEQQSEWERDHEILKAYADGQESMKPCKDAISRQAAIDAVEKTKSAMTTDGEIYVAKINAEMNIQQLPSVSTEKTGRWEWNQYDYNPNLGNWHCSECRSVVIECVDKNKKGGIPLYKYCPQCGTKMEVEDG